VWVDGRRLVDNKQPTTFDIATVRKEAQAAAEELFARRASLTKTD
jgi:5-methylthioadenosine/S-adenosylhomocysteine deaminase